MSFVPDVSWLAAFTAQITAELLERARRYATKHARWIERAGGQVDPMDLVLGVIDDTRAGILRWDPGGCGLEAHVILAIGSRARHLRDHARRFRHQPIDPDRSSDPVVEGALHAQRPPPPPEERALAGESLAIIRAHAREDADILALLDAYARDAFTRQEVMAVTQWPERRYRNVRLRLERLIAGREIDAAHLLG